MLSALSVNFSKVLCLFLVCDQILHKPKFNVNSEVKFFMAVCHISEKIRLVRLHNVIKIYKANQEL